MLEDRAPPVLDLRVFGVSMKLTMVVCKENTDAHCGFNEGTIEQDDEVVHWHVFFLQELVNSGPSLRMACSTVGSHLLRTCWFKLHGPKYESGFTMSPPSCQIHSF